MVSTAAERVGRIDDSVTQEGTFDVFCAGCYKLTRLRKAG